jgi:hypothetical protein
MRFSALQVLMDQNIHCAPVLENHTSCLVRQVSQKVLFNKNKKTRLTAVREPGFF